MLRCGLVIVGCVILWCIFMIRLRCGWCWMDLYFLWVMFNCCCKCLRFGMFELEVRFDMLDLSLM